MQKPWQTGAHIGNLRLPFSLFFCFSKRKRWQKKTSRGDFDFPRPPLNRPEKPLRFLWESATNLQLPNGPMCTGKRQTHIRNAPSSRTAVTGIGLYGHAGKCIRIRRRFSIIRCILPGGAEPRPYQLHTFSHAGRSNWVLHQPES